MDNEYQVERIPDNEYQIERIPDNEYRITNTRGSPPLAKRRAPSRDPGLLEAALGIAGRG